MPDWIAIKGVLKALVLPPGGPLLLALVGLVMWHARPRVARLLVGCGVLGLLALSLPPVSAALQRTLYSGAPFDYAHAREAQALVILGGGVRRDAPEYGGDTLASITLERVRYGARVARQTRLPVLVSGGVVYAGTPEARLMREALESEFNVPVRWTEDRSRTTHENAVLSAKILRAEGVRRIVLVAHAFDIPRATAEFAAQGIATIPAPTGIASWHYDAPSDLLPSMSALHGSYYALYEMGGEIVRRMSEATSVQRAAP
ncbi:MAG TPA: YdcF family protein [Casimicrobiaceae bacterium]|nr:YdcF family protein [Casimicrobiaceae bacterium]